MRFQIIVTALFTFFLSSPAVADWNSVGGLRSGCKGLLANDSTVDDFSTGICLGWIMSEGHWRQLACTYLQLGHGVTVPGVFTQVGARDFRNHTTEAVMQGFVNWADDNPQSWADKPNALGQNKEIWADFPCDPKAPLQSEN